MRNILLLCLLFISGNVLGQTDGMSYQAMILNPNLELPGANDTNNVYPNKQLIVKFTITNDSGIEEYQETQATATDQFGMINLIIGSGVSSIGSFSSIFWNGTPKKLKVEINLDGVFKELSTQELLFTPVAYHRDIIATGSLSVFGATTFDSTLTVNGASVLNNTLKVNNGFATSLTGDLTVDGTTNLNKSLAVNNGAVTSLTGNLTVDGTTNLNKSFAVNNGAVTSLTGNLTVDGTTNLNKSLAVNNGAVTSLTGNLTVDGTTNLNKSLAVNNGAVTSLTGNLTVDGTTNLNKSLAVNNGAATSLTGNLSVDGTTNLNKSLSVNNGAATSLTGNLSVTGTSNLNNTLLVSGVTTLQNKLQANGQVTINATFPTDEANYDAYPLRVQGSGQGIAIKLEEGTPNNSNNFITFFNAAGGTVGRIEGETTSEATSDPEFIFNNSMLVAEEIKAGVNVGTSFIPVAVAGLVVSAGPCGACIAAAAADLVLATANLVAYNVFALTDLGVTYQSGSADYAEWLERSNPNETILPGEIVAVNAGKISKYTTNSQQFMVISTKPAILGNMPMDGKEGLYNKVAFLGQIPVKVRGLVLAGDYIVPSGKNDGTGIGISPSEISAKQYKEIVGVAWSSVIFDSGNYSLVNMAIGLNTNDIAQFAEKQELKIQSLEAKYKSLEERLIALETGKSSSLKTYAVSEIINPNQKSNQETTPLSRYELLASNMPKELSDSIMEDAFLYLQNGYKENGIDITKHKGLNKLFNDPIFKAEVIKKTRDNYKKSYLNLLSRTKN